VANHWRRAGADHDSRPLALFGANALKIRAAAGSPVIGARRFHDHDHPARGRRLGRHDWRARRCRLPPSRHL
jgi:hypothetical protein